jgi:hypothetical protein
MKTTIEIPDPLLNDARRVAAREGSTVRSLVEQGLRRVLAEKLPGRDYKLKRASFKGNGVCQGLHEGQWQSLRNLIYADRGA